MSEIIKFLLNLVEKLFLFEGLKKEKEELKQINQRLELQKKELIQQHFNLVQKYVTLFQKQKDTEEKLMRSLSLYSVSSSEVIETNFVRQLIYEFN